MHNVSKRRGGPLPGAGSNIEPIIFALKEALGVEHLYRPDAVAIQSNVLPGEVTLELRDGVVHLLRFLRVWFDVPDNIFFSAVTYLDLFLERITVKEKYLKCVAFACFLVALVKEGIVSSTDGATKLVSVSPCNFGSQDIIRMSNIVCEKLNLNKPNVKMTNAADILKIYLKYLGSSCSLLRETLHEEKLITKLEVLMADSTCAFFWPSTLSYTLIIWEFDRLMSQSLSTNGTPSNEVIMDTFLIIKELQHICKITVADLGNCSQHASKVLKKYHNEDRCQNNLYLRWKTLPKCRLHRTRPSLDIIKEKQKPKRRPRGRKAQLRTPSTA